MRMPLESGGVTHMIHIRMINKRRWVVQQRSAALEPFKIQTVFKQTLGSYVECFEGNQTKSGLCQLEVQL